MEHTPNHQRIEQERQRFQHALEEYLAALETASRAVLEERKHDLLSAYAEYRYQVQGGTHCVLCRAHVRHTMLVEVRREDGTTSQFAALCTRCLEGEKALAESVTLRVGPVEYETLRRSHEQPPHRGHSAVA